MLVCTELHHDAREHFENVACDNWATLFSDVSIILVMSNQYFAPALRQNPYHVRTCPASAHVICSFSSHCACWSVEFLVSRCRSKFYLFALCFRSENPIGTNAKSQANGGSMFATIASVLFQPTEAVLNSVHSLKASVANYNPTKVVGVAALLDAAIQQFMSHDTRASAEEAESSRTRQAWLGNFSIAWLGSHLLCFHSFSHLTPPAVARFLAAAGFLPPRAPC